MGNFNHLSAKVFVNLSLSNIPINIQQQNSICLRSFFPKERTYSEGRKDLEEAEAVKSAAISTNSDRLWNVGYEDWREIFAGQWWMHQTILEKGAWHRGCVRASHPATLGSNLSILTLNFQTIEIFSAMIWCSKTRKLLSCYCTAIKRRY